MDLNYLFHRQQVERARSDIASSDGARTAHQAFARRYEEQIESVTGSVYRFPREE